MKEAIEAGLRAYADHGVPPGGFLEAVLTNNLMEAFGSADAENTADMREIVTFVRWEIPAACHGDWEAVDRWLEMHRERREAERQIERLWGSSKVIVDRALAETESGERVSESVVEGGGDDGDR